MRRILLAISSALFAVGLFCIAQAQSPAVMAVILGPVRPQWAPIVEGSLPVVACQLSIPQCWSPNTGITSLDSFQFSFTRATARLALWSANYYTSFVSGQKAYTDMGFWSDKAVTNLALWSRDLTQAGTWSASVTITPALNATGIDLSANSATTLTAGVSCVTACAITQSVTQASTLDAVSAFVKCVTCTGNIQMSLGAGSASYTTLDSSNCVNPVTGVAANLTTSLFLRCSLTATLANPVIGFNIANASDAIIVDGVQLEAFGGPTSPCFSAGTSCVRNADVLRLSTTVCNSLYATGTLIVQVNSGLGGVSGNDFTGLGPGYHLVGVVNNYYDYNTAFGNLVQAEIPTGNISSQKSRFSMSFSSTARAMAANGGVVGTNANGPGTPGNCYLGADSTGDALNGAMQYFAVYPNQFTNADLILYSAPK